MDCTGVAGSTEEEQEPPIPLAEVFKRLRKLKHPVTLFGETPWKRYLRVITPLWLAVLLVFLFGIISHLFLHLLHVGSLQHAKVVAPTCYYAGLRVNSSGICMATGVQIADFGVD